ncbi:hemolysin III [Evansella caseinilytica]|uniref:Hemolysin III n=1 Tax=Evansella caseinilytica TaxID=1503961 RepID=A0A1H3QVS8_9BACI|nr:hemolysin III family protein [Evansella caseinilytica]SDZ17125.1 hemolysin III [Evansella caseinilytica]
MASTHTFTKGEEIANSITHGLGALFSIAALVLLIIFSALYGNTWHIVSFTIFGVTMVLLYIASTFVHALPPGKAKNVFEILDHSSIYFFIAGTYTPFLFIALQDWRGWTIFAIVWGLAIGGTVFKCFFVKRFLFSSTILYVFMGWMIVFVWQPLKESLYPAGLNLLILGGILYTVGAVFYVWRGFKYHHAVWHIFVLAGTASHFASVLFYLLPLVD